MQYRVGTVDVTNGSAVVTGDVSKWLAEVTVGDLFNVIGINATYQIGSIDSDTQITLTAPYAGATQLGVDYAISRDFTPIRKIPYLTKGDIDTATILQKSFEVIDNFVGGITTETAAGGSPIVTTVIASHAIATYRSAEYLIQAVRGNNFHTTKIVAIHDGTNAEYTEYASLSIPSFFGSPSVGSPTNSGTQATFSVDVSGGNLRLLATPRGGTGSITFKVTSTLTTV